MNNQEVFDTVAEHLMKQGRRAFDDNRGECRYRAPNGDMCAVGCLIPDSLYNEYEMEGENASEMIESSPELRSLFDKDISLNLIDGLQAAHDHDLHMSMDSWVYSMRYLAKKHKLNDAILDEYEEADK
jgi:hypothetical protein